MTNCFPTILLEYRWLYIVLIFIYINRKAFADNRCYLENGASSETFFVSEDLPVGEVLGRVRFLGDPRPGIGTIHIRLKEMDSPIAIEPGTKSLILQRPLDKEGIDGPSSVFLNVLCTRLGTKDPDFVIPINIRVTDANDNKPIFLNTPYILNVSETTVVGTRVYDKIRAVDSDQQGPNSNVKYIILSGPNSEFFDLENEMEGNIILRKPLDYEQIKYLNFTIRAQDHGEPPLFTDAMVTVFVQDFDDQNPRFRDERYTATLPEPALKGTKVPIKPRHIQAFDQDEGIREKVLYSWDGREPDYSMFLLDAQSGEVKIARDLQDDDLTHPAILVVKATQGNNKDRYALVTLTISRQLFHEGVKFSQRIFNILASEGLPPGSVITVLTNNKPHHPLKYFVSNQDVLKTFMINSLGEIAIKKKLDYEKEYQYKFKVFATDGKTNDSALVNITVENVNEWEPQFRYARYEFLARANGDVIGKIEVADGDRDDNITLSIGGGDAELFLLNQEGEIRLKTGAGPRPPTAMFTITATDSGKPQKATTIPIVVRFEELTTSDSASANSESAASRDKDNSMMSNMLMAGLGATLLLLSFIFVFLVACLCKMKQKPPPLPVAPQAEKLPKRPVKNPVFGDDKGTTPSAVLSRVESRQSILSQSGVSNLGPSGVVGQSGQPNMNQLNLNQSILKTQNLRQKSQSSTILWPAVAQNLRVKECWAEKDDDNVNIDSTTPKVLRSSNLTVYF